MSLRVPGGQGIWRPGKEILYDRIYIREYVPYINYIGSRCKYLPGKTLLPGNGGFLIKKDNDRSRDE